MKAAVERALTHVPEPYRTAIILRDLEEMSYDEIAEVLQISLGTVKSTHYARARCPAQEAGEICAGSGAGVGSGGSGRRQALRSQHESEFEWG